jgi:beta-galactosidase
MTTTYCNKQIFIDGKPVLILAGEIHYFRLSRAVWQDRLDRLRQVGCNTVATYIPWLCHEPVQGRIDLAGQTRAELDLAAFIDLCQANGFWFIARPGPFVMAELKNEGLPYWLYEQYPEIIPPGWDGQPATTRTVDYLAPRFLAAVDRWYAAVMPLLAQHLQPAGGPVIGVQLDNEIGMLSWCSNTPDLTDHLLDDCVAWLRARYDAATLEARYPFSLDIPLRYRTALRSPQESWVLRWRHDLGYYLRQRHARYADYLRQRAEAYGVCGVPFFLNIHGTGGGRGFTYPIGISQLYEAYTRSPAFLAGTDYYFGNLTCDNFQDLYLCNAFTAASQRPDQPLCSLEFECGDGDYGNMQANRLDPLALALKLKMSLAQGHRLINFYLFTGGYNYSLDPAPGDGDDRIAITGECHGVAAPVKADGRLSSLFPSMVQTVQAVARDADYWASSVEEWDDVRVGFIPDDYMTEHRYPGSVRLRALIDNLQANRAYGAWESLLRALLLAGYRYGAIDLQNTPVTQWGTAVLVLPSARYMAAGLQEKLAEWLAGGGRLLLYGEVPVYDQEGESCERLAECLGVKPGAVRHSGEGVYLSLEASGWASPRPAVRTHFAQCFSGNELQPVLRLHDTGAVTAFETGVGPGRAIIVATAYPCDVAFFRTAVQRLGVSPALRHDSPDGGIFMTTTVNAEGVRYLHLINLDALDKSFRVWWHDSLVNEGSPFYLPARGVWSGRMG